MRGHVTVMAVDSGYPRPLRHQLANPKVLSRSPGQRHSPDNCRLIRADGAAGVAASLNTPLAGIEFAIQELPRSVEERVAEATLTTVVLTGMIAIALAGDYTYFGQAVVSGVAAE